MGVGQRRRDDIGIGRMCSEFEAWLFIKPVEFLPKGQRQTREREREIIPTTK